MIIRGVLILSLAVVLGLILYLPATTEPRAFYANIDTEVASASHWWGDAHLITAMQRTLIWKAEVKRRYVDTQAKNPGRTRAINARLRQDIEAMGDRLKSNQYLRSLDALWLLATFRLSCVVVWLPFFGVLFSAFLFDGLVRRGIKSKEFVQHSPEVFAVSICSCIVVLCGLAVAVVAPVTLHPALIPGALASIAMLCGAAAANYHQNA